MLIIHFKTQVREIGDRERTIGEGREGDDVRGGEICVGVCREGVATFTVRIGRGRCGEALERGRVDRRGGGGRGDGVLGVEAGRRGNAGCGVVDGSRDLDRLRGRGVVGGIMSVACRWEGSDQRAQQQSGDQHIDSVSPWKLSRSGGSAYTSRAR